MSNPAPTPDYETPFTDASVVPGALPGQPGYAPTDNLIPMGGAAPGAVPGAPVGSVAIPVTAPNGSGPLPPSTVPIVPPPEYGPAEPSPTDAIMAGLPPAQAGIPTRDQDQELAPAVPREAPGNVGTPGAPNAQPADAAPGTTGDVKDKLDAEAKARGETTEAQGRVGEDEQEKKDAQAQAATEARAEAQRHIATAQAIQDQYDKADKATQDQIGQMRAARQNFKLKDYWADKSGFQHAISALGVALGALGWGLTKTPNYALQILDKKMDDDHRNQVDQLNKLSDDEMQARTGLQDSQKARALALANVDVGHADRLKLVAAKLEERSATADDLNYKNTLAAKAAELRQKAAESETDATKTLRTMNLQDQQAALAGRKEAAEEEYLKQHGDYFEKGGAKGRRGTGGGSGSGEALAKFTEAATDGKTTDAELARMGAAARLRPNQVSADVERIRKNKTAGPTGVLPKAGAGLAGDRLLSKEAESWKKENGVDAIAKTQRELGALQKEMADNAGNPLQQALAVEKAVSAARGGAASKQALGLALQHLGGSLDNAEGVIQKMKDGQLAPKQLENFNSFIKGQLGASQKEGKDAYDNFNKYIETQPPEKKAALEAERGRIFSGLHGFGSQDDGGSSGRPHELPVGATKTLANGKTVKKVGPNNWQPVAQ